MNEEYDKIRYWNFYKQEYRYRKKPTKEFNSIDNANKRICELQSQLQAYKDKEDKLKELITAPIDCIMIFSGKDKSRYR